MYWSGIFDVTEAYEEAIKVATAESLEVIPQTSILEIANARSQHLRADHSCRQNPGCAPVLVLRSPFNLHALCLKASSVIHPYLFHY